jgi:hypothetical protein
VGETGGVGGEGSRAAICARGGEWRERLGAAERADVLVSLIYPSVALSTSIWAVFSVFSSTYVIIARP